MTGPKIGKKELAIIHIAKSQCGWSDDEYRHTLKDGFGVSSSKDLTSKQADKLISLFRAEGFQIVSHTKKEGQAGYDRLPMIRKISAILRDIGKKEAYADGIARRMFKVDAIRWCTPEQLLKVVASLEYTRNKMTGEGPAESRARKMKKERTAQKDQSISEGGKA